jgi:hypothetical protein
MKTPWRFLADLVSRKPSPGTTDDLSSTAEPVKAIELDREPDAQDADIDAEVTIGTTTDLTEPRDRAGPTGSGSEASISFEEDQSRHAASVEELAPEATTPLGADALASGSAPDEPVEPEFPGDDPSATPPVDATSGRRRKPVQSRQSIDVAGEPAVQKDASASLTLKSEAETMRELDEDIAALRRTLSEKLILQNAQLMKLLARYDRD